MKNGTLTGRLLIGFPFATMGLGYFLKLIFVKTSFTFFSLVGLYSFLLIALSVNNDVHLFNQASTISSLFLLLVFIVVIPVPFYFAGNRLKDSIPAVGIFKNASLNGDSLIAPAVFKERNQ